MPLPIWAQRVTLETLCDLYESGCCSLSVCSHRPAQWHGLSGSVENNSKRKQYDSSQSYMRRCVCAVPCRAVPCGARGRHSLRCWPCIGMNNRCRCSVCICVVSVCRVYLCGVCVPCVSVWCWCALCTCVVLVRPVYLCVGSFARFV